MTKKPWMKWYPADWRQEPCLRMCSRAARSFWMDLLGLMHDAEPYGHLLVKGKAPSDKQIAAILGDTAKDASKWIGELEEAGVFSRTEDGTIYSRRMVRDAERSEEGKKWIGKRWATDDPNRGPNRGATPEPTENPITQKPETRGQKLEEEFSQWWEVWPEKRDKAIAEQKFRKAREVVPLETLIAGVERYKRHVVAERARGFALAYCGPAVWLGQRRWENEYPTDNVTQIDDAPPSRRAYRAAFAKWVDAGKNGPQPRLEDFKHLDGEAAA